MNPRISVIFAGQGAQTPGMGQDLTRISSRAKEVFNQADQAVAGHLKHSLSHLCFDAPMEELTSCTNCQPAIYTMTMACYQALQEACPFQPAGTAGLSLGEYAALTAAGVLSLEDGLDFVSHRGRFMDECCRRTRGRMAAVLGQSEEEVRALCSQYDLDIANLNCPGQIIISGAAEKLDALENNLTGDFPKIIFLEVDGAYHSRLMQPAAEQFRNFCKDRSLQKPSCPLAQNYTGDFCEEPETIRENLIAQIFSTVRWEDCMRKLMDQSDLIIEFGPGHVLSGLGKRISRKFPVLTVNSAETLESTIKELQK